MQILPKYADFLNVFLERKALILLEATKLNQHAIKLQKGQQLSCRPIYNIDLVELKTLKTYIKINFANGFIWLLYSFAGAHIFFVRKSDNKLRLYVDYRGLNNFMIKNQYLLPLIGKSLDQLGQAKKFI